MAGGVDIHTSRYRPEGQHGRNVQPEDKLHDTGGIESSSRARRARGGYFGTIDVHHCISRYARLGYTFVNEAAMPPLLARHHPWKKDHPTLRSLTSSFHTTGDNWIAMESVGKAKPTSWTPLLHRY